MISNQQFVETKFVKSFGNLYETLKEHKAMVAGGIFTSLYTNKEVNDIDVYFATREQAGEFLAEWPGRIVSVTNKSITLVGVYDLPPMQIIWSMPVGNLQALFQHFDFTINMAGFDFATETFHYHPDFMSDLAGRRLSFNPKTAFPLISALRVHKYKERGFECSRKEMLKILLQISTLKIETAEELAKAIGGMYGEAIRLELPEGKVDLSLVIDQLSASITAEKAYSFLPEVLTSATVLISPSNLGDLLCKKDLFDGGWVYKNQDEVIYKENGRIIPIPACVALGLAPEQECKPSEAVKTTHLVYKWVNKTSDPTVFTSFFDPSFKYELGVKVENVNKDHGIYTVFGKDINCTTYTNRPGGVVLCLMVEEKHRVKGTTQFTEALPLYVCEPSKAKGSDPYSSESLLKDSHKETKVEENSQITEVVVTSGISLT